MKKSRFVRGLSSVAAMLLCATLLAGVGCSPNDIEDVNGGKDVDPNKTQVYIGNYDGGLGHEWLNVLITEFEKEHTDVQIWIDPKKDEYGNNILEANIKTNRQDMYFLDYNQYYNYIQHFSDITTEVTEPLTEYGENESIEAKMNTGLKDWYKTPDEKYYGVPVYEAFYSMIYDVDLFEEKKFFFKDDGNYGTDGFITSLSDKKSAGPDGEYNTWDDGLPVYYSEFFELLKYMRDSGVTPLTVTGQHEYFTSMVTNFFADYEGVDEFNKYFAVKGEVEVIDEFGTEDPAETFTSNSFTTKKVTISNANAEELDKMPGKYYAAKFTQDLAANSLNYTGASVSPVQSHIAAQEEFLYSRRLNEPIGMIVEGGWWENEADSIFSDMQESYGSKWAKENRRFAIMPTPKADDESSAEGRTYCALTSGASVAAISKYSKNQEICKEFLRFCHTDKALNIFTQYTGVFKPYDYDLTEEAYNNMSYYGKHVADTRDEISVVYAMPRDQKYNDMLNFFNYSMMTSTVNDANVATGLKSFFDYKDLTAKELFLGYDDCSVGSWNVIKGL